MNPFSTPSHGTLLFGERRVSPFAVLTLAVVVIVLFFGLVLPLFSVLKNAFILPAETYTVSAGETWEVIEELTGGSYSAAHLRRVNPQVAGDPVPGSSIILSPRRFSLSLFLMTVSNPVYRSVLFNSFFLGLVVTFLCLLVSLPVAVVTGRFSFKGKSLVNLLVLLPLVLPPFVGAVGVKRMLGRFGLLNLLLLKLGVVTESLDLLGGGRFWAVAVLEVLHLFPVMLLNLQASMAAQDPSIEEAAENLGDSGLGLFWRVTFPRLVPGIFAGGAITFIWAFTDLGTPLVLEYQQVVAKQIFDMVQELGTNPVGYALVMETLLLAIAVFVVGRLLASFFSSRSAGKGTPSTFRRPLGDRHTAIFWVAFGLLVFLAVLPHVAVILTTFSGRWFMTVFPDHLTFDHLRTVVNHPVTAGSVRNSVLLSLASTSLDVFLGIAIGLLALRLIPRLGRIADVMAMVPLAVPGLIMAYGLMSVYGGLASNTGAGFLRSLLSLIDPRINPMGLLVLSYAVRRLPFTTRAVAAGLSYVPPEVEEASLNLGASPGRTLRRITFPLMWGHIVAGAVLTFSFAMLEVSDSLVLAQKEEHFPITAAIYNMLHRLADGINVASALGMFAMALLLFSLMLSSRLSGRRMGDMLRF
ncbi:MAG: iron ABC transporter permease [Planctomycetes bacterium]|nr:iron ABC transporter permease [Planctomycetota bacterium]